MMEPRQRLLAAVLLALGLTVGPAAGHAASVIASFEPSTISAGESAKLSITFSDVPRNAVQQPSIPSVAGLDVRYLGQSTSMRMTGAETRLSVAFNYQVTPAQPGEYVIPALDLSTAGERLRTLPATLKVLKRGDSSAPIASAQQRWAYLMLIPDKEEVFLGEMLPLRLDFYIVDGQDYAPEPLTSEGFVFSPLEAAGQQRVQVQGRVYYQLRHTQNAFATKTGDLTLGPAEARVTLRLPRTRQRGNDPFDSFFGFDPFGRNVELRPATVQSEPRTIKVKPLPGDGVPASFRGAVGQFALEVTASPTNVAVGEPIQLRVRISGQGQMENVTLPLGEGWDGFRAYPPRTQLDVTDASTARGVKTFEQDVVPLNVSQTELPGIEFSYFDPVAAGYRTLSHPPTRLLVRPAASTQTLAPLAGSSANGGSEAPPPPQALVPIKQRPGALAVIRPPLLVRGWFQGLLVLPLLGLGAAVGWRRWREHLARNPLVARRLAFGRQRRQMVEELRRLAATGDPEAFFAHTFRMLQEQIGERLDLPAAAITEAVIEEKLRPRGAPQGLQNDLHQLFQTCNQARYAPVAESKDLPGLAQHVEKTLDRTRQLLA